MKPQTRAFQRATLTKRREEIAQLYLQGKSQTEIAKQFGVTQQAISHHVKIISAWWRESAVLDFNAAKELEIARINQVAVEAWQAWERTVGKHVTTRTEQSLRGSAEQAGRSAKKIETSEDLAGDPRFLDVVYRCIAKRCEILGLDAPIKSTVDGKLRIEDARNKLARTLADMSAKLAARRDPERSDG